MADQKQELLRMLKGKTVKGYNFSLQEDENKVVASLTNSAVRKPIDLNKAGTGLVLSYTQVKDKKKKTTRTFKSEVKTDGPNVAIIVRDLVTNRVISKNSFPSPIPHEEQGLKPSNNVFKTSVASTAENYSVRQTGPANLSSRRSSVALKMGTASASIWYFTQTHFAAKSCRMCRLWKV